MSETQRRLFNNADARFTVLPAQPDHPRTLAGYALRWNVVSTDRGGYVVRLIPGSVRFATPTLALWYHDFAQPIGTTANGSLRLTSDDIGVRFELDLPDTSIGRDTFELVSKQYVAGMSFAMADTPKGKTTRENGVDVFNVTDVLVDEISVVVNPAFLDTTVSTSPAPVAATPNKPAPSGGGFSERARQSNRLAGFSFDLLRLA